MKNIEFEYKIIISQQVYTKLNTYLQNNFTFISYRQKNIYYDTNNNILKENLAAFRLREKEDNFFEWTFKKATSEKYKQVEIKQKVKTNDISLVNTKITEKLNNLNIDVNDLKPICDVLTNRTDFCYFGSTLSLDFNLFNNSTSSDYELELEINSESAIKPFNNLLKEFKIDLIQSKSKVARAMSYK